MVGALAADGKKASYSSVTSTMWVSGFGGESGVNTATLSGYSGVVLEPAIMTTDKSGCARGYVSNDDDKRRYNAFNDDTSPHPENANCNYASTFNGTSSAAPAVAGVVALMLEKNPALTLRDVKHILATTARQVDASFSSATLDSIAYHQWETNGAGLKHHNYYGFGAVDANAAVTAAGTYTAGSLGSQSTSSWITQSVDANLGEKTATYWTLNNASSGTVEFVWVRLNLNLAGNTEWSTGIRLQSPSGTVSTILQPLTWANDNTTVSENIYLASAAFYGEAMAGDWKIYIYDHASDSDVVYVDDLAIKFFYR